VPRDGITAQKLGESIGGAFNRNMKAAIPAAILVAGIALITAVGLCAEDRVGQASPGSFMERYDLPRAPEDALKEILAREEFRPDPIQSLRERIMRELREGLQRLLSMIIKKIPFPRGVGIDREAAWTAVMGVLLGMAALGIVLAVVSAVGFVARRTLRHGPEDREAPEDPASDLSGNELWERAMLAAGTENYGDGVIHLFRWAVRRLDETGCLGFSSGKTNSELLASLGGQTHLRTCLGPMIPIFNRVRYGNASCAGSEFEEVLGLCRRMREGT
jgi:hypothetical protein